MNATGVLADETAAMLRRPIGSNRCAFLAGAATAAGMGTFDVDLDLDAIEAAGFETAVLGRSAEAGASGAWPPPETAEVLHYAGHLVPTGPDVTEMILADGTTVPVHRVRETDLRSVQVAVLMCCYSSSAHLAFAGEQIQHLAGAFLEAGTAAVIACRWPAFDLPARLFTNRFYGDLGSGSDVASSFAAGVDAIRAHRVDGMTPFGHPVFWAGFTLFAGAGSWISTLPPELGRPDSGA